MPKQIPEKCRRCARLSAEAAQTRHGPEGDDCWDPKRCHQRRHHARHRDRINQTRNQKRWEREGRIPPQVLQIDAPPVVAGVLVLYRINAHSPIHAIGAEVWRGQERIASVQPVHCFGFTARQVQGYVAQMLQVLSKEYGISKFASQVELHPQQCPLDPCPHQSGPLLN